MDRQLPNRKCTSNLNIQIYRLFMNILFTFFFFVFSSSLCCCGWHFQVFCCCCSVFVLFIRLSGSCFCFFIFLSWNLTLLQICVALTSINRSLHSPLSLSINDFGWNGHSSQTVFAIQTKINKNRKKRNNFHINKLKLFTTHMRLHFPYWSRRSNLSVLFVNTLKTINWITPYSIGCYF